MEDRSISLSHDTWLNNSEEVKNSDLWFEALLKPEYKEKYKNIDKEGLHTEIDTKLPVDKILKVSPALAKEVKNSQLPFLNQSAIEPKSLLELSSEAIDFNKIILPMKDSAFVNFSNTTVGKDVKNKLEIEKEKGKDPKVVIGIY